MASFDTTSVYLNTRKSKYGEPVVIYRVPVPLVNESFYFNQEAIQAIVRYKHRSTFVSKESDIASIHLTNKRLILLSQSTSIAPTDMNHFDTCEMQLSDFQSLKSDTRMHKKRIRFDIETIRNETIRIDIKFKSKKDANRRESLKEYIKMATSAIAASQFRNYSQPSQQTQQDNLPSYFEATHSNTANATAPPAYS
ncbi:hypothetical protein HMPREF1544_08146 [Mucor circinelloides 1006PhL]|uniref:Uncharacterized protein n=1 Tax=Mucor circinelloides f. circinelloides (strain 1006PhL) TaxID=1220926 RepID=S2J609_MUCC1|nr:hypothetical protein HMPREF1544_08146 [Mucor circinelloides 1006PhL]